MLPESGLSRREREVMEIIYAQEQATAAQVREGLEDPPTDAAVRSILRILVEKEHLTHEFDGPRYVYSPTVSASTARRTALQRVLSTFFDGSTEGAMAALLEVRGPLSDGERDRLKKLIDGAAAEGR